MVVLGKAHSHSFLICRLIRKSIMPKKNQEEKLIQTCAALPSTYEVLIRTNVTFLNHKMMKQVGNFDRVAEGS